MKKDIKKAAVLGAGTMGSGIAALLTSVGVKTYLLDIVAKELTDEEKKKGLTLDNPKVRNRIATLGLDRALKARPAVFYDKDDANLITLGNVEDNIEYLKEVDWIVEAVFERMDVKKNAFSLIEKNCSKDCIITSNTSGLSINSIVQDCSSSLKRRTLVTHFFNPVRYMKLLEIVPTKETDKEILNFITDYGERILGKGVVLAKDTPNFIANRIGIFGIMFLIKSMLEEGLKIEEIDKIFGPSLGRPKSAVFRTADIVGLDVLSDVIKNMYQTLPNDEMREIYKVPDFIAKMVEKGILGNKTKKGFYQQVVVSGKKEFHVFDYEKMDYRPQIDVKFESLGKARGLEDVGAKVKAIVNSDDKAGKFAWKVLSETLLYSARRIPEIADDIYSIDNAMKWGFNWQLGPFETWDAIGLKESVARMEKEGKEIPNVVLDVLKKGESFYKKEEGKKLYFELGKRNYLELKRPSGIILLPELKEAKKVVKKMLGASLIDLGDGVACLEFHTQMNAIDDDIIKMMNYSLEEVDKNFLGLVIGNEGEHFSAGANVMLLLVAMQNKDWKTIDTMVKNFQDANMAIKYSRFPVIAAPFNMTLGGGAEITMACHKVRAHCELYIGLVEFGMGLIPGGGGCKEVWIRNTEGIPSDANVDLFPLLQRTFETIGLAKVSTSAKDAKRLGLLRSTDKITMNKERLIADAKETVLAMIKEGFEPFREKKIKVLGTSGFGALAVGIKNFQWGKKITDHEALMATQLAKVITGGDVLEGTEVSEQRLLDIEREAFLFLCGTEKTQERIRHFLTTGKPLRN